MVASMALASTAAAATPEVSANWSGYVVGAASGAPATTFSDVAATWVEPKVRCTTGDIAAAAFWVGLGGSQNTSTALEQLGTQATCSANGVASYRAWYELVPAPSVTIRLKVRPGDTMRAALAVSGNEVTLTMLDVTRRTRFTRQLTLAQPPDVSSAEWIAEAPSLCADPSHCRIVPLADFGSVDFSSASAIANAHPGRIVDSTWEATPIDLASDSRQFLGGTSASYGALPSNLGPDGGSFSVAWQPSPPTIAGGGLDGRLLG